MWSFKFKEFEVIDKKNISSKFLANKKISRRCPNSRRCFNSNKRSDSRFIENWGSKWWSLWERNKEKRLGFRELVGRLLLPRRRFNFTPSLIPSRHLKTVPSRISVNISPRLLKLRWIQQQGERKINTVCGEREKKKETDKKQPLQQTWKSRSKFFHRDPSILFSLRSIPPLLSSSLSIFYYTKR